MSFLRDLTLGSEFIPDRKMYKYARLRVNFCLTYICVAFFYIIFDGYNGFYGFLPLYILIILLSLACLVVNRLKYFGLANGMMIIFSNALVYLFADSDDPFGGMFFYFLGTALAAMVLFNYELRYWAFSFVVVSIVLSILAFTTNLNLIELPIIQDNSIIRITFLINFVLATLTCSLIVFFLIRENYTSETELHAKQQQLLNAAADLKRSNAQLEMALRGTMAGIYEWNLKENTVHVSSYWKNLLGFNEDELSDISLETFKSFIHPEDADRINKELADTLSSKRSYQTEIRIRTKRDDYKWFLDSGVVNVDNSGSPYLVIGTLMDIDDRKKAEQEITVKNRQLLKTNEELDRFVYSASHDMRAPLSSILGLINLSEMTENLEELRVYSGMMKDRIKVMEGFIKEVTDYSRNTRLDLNISNVSLHSLANDVVNHLLLAHGNKNVKIDVVINPDLSIVTDAGRVKVVLSNLISNSFKYHRAQIANSYVRIKACKFDGHVLVKVEDNGLGIGEEHHNLIFNMFYRATDISDGSGLGLYIVKETLQKLGGDISVQSKVNVGTTFSFSLPNLG